MTNYILKLATRNQQNYNDKIVRVKVGYAAGIVGIMVNVILTVIKISIGLLIKSVSVIADGINNLCDAASSLITIVGFKLANTPPDKEHPYGHGRLEYISALVVAGMVIIVGFQFIKTSIERIKNPKQVKFELFSFSILIISIGFKIWLSRFNKVVGEKINSTGLKASGIDALGDVLTTSVVVISIIIGQFTTLPIDGIFGVIVSILIIYNGYSLVKETLNPLIGEAPDGEMVKSINSDILSYDYIVGIHDLVVHNYGAARTMATIDVEFLGNIDVFAIHNVIDKIEREIGEKYNLTLVIHMDPLDIESSERKGILSEIKRIIKENPLIKSIHDFQIIEDYPRSVFECHVVVDGNLITRNTSPEMIKSDIEHCIKEKCKDIEGIIVVDVEY